VLVRRVLQGDDRTVIWGTLESADLWWTVRGGPGRDGYELALSCAGEAG
jgi:hypothetical protein